MCLERVGVVRLDVAFENGEETMWLFMSLGVIVGIHVVSSPLSRPLFFGWLETHVWSAVWCA